MFFKCNKCSAIFKKKFNAERHFETQHPEGEPDTIHCAHCDTKFKRKDNLIVHLKRLHPEINSIEEPVAKKSFIQKQCNSCGVLVDNDKFQSHIASFEHLTELKQGPIVVDVEILKTAFNGQIVAYKISTEKNKDDIKNYLETTKIYMLKIIDDYIQLYNRLKFNLQLHVKYMKGKSSIDTKIFITKNLAYDCGQDFTAIFYDQLINPLVNQSEEFQEYDSGWAFIEVAFLEIYINKFDPFYGSSYITLPQWIKQKHAIINVTNHDKACFAWSVISAMYPVDRKKHPDRIKSYPHYSKILRLDNITFPMKIIDIPKFESLNQQISVNVFGLDDEKIIGPIYHTRKRKENHINLLYIQNGVGDGHYCWIKDMSRLISNQVSPRRNKKHICDGCLMIFNAKDNKLQRHQERDCGRAVVVLPQDERYLKFGNFQKTRKVPFVVYVNFDTLLQSAKPWLGDSEQPNGIHEPYGFSYYVRCSFHSDFNKLRIYRGPNCVNEFWSQLQKDLEWIYVCSKSYDGSELNPKPQNCFRELEKCQICDKPFVSKGQKVQNPNTDGSFCQDPSHPRNNASRRVLFFVPVILHRLTENQANFLIREIPHIKEHIEAVPYSTDKCISLIKRVKLDTAIVKLRFIDTYRFLSTNLAELSGNLSPEKFHMLANEFSGQEDFDLLKQPSIFPCDFVPEELNRDSSPPAKEAFSDTLSGYELGDDHYQRIRTIWSKFKCKSLGDYADLCMKIDVLHLTDVFEHFRTSFVSTYHIDPAHFFTLQDLSWEAMLNTTNTTLELLTDFEMLQFFKNGIRGGLAQCSKRKATANNKYMFEYDAEKDSSYLVYLSANNLYGWAMSQPLPTGSFRWLRQSEIDSFDVTKISRNDRKGYVLEVDLEYPEQIHDLHSDFPFCPEKQSILESSRDTTLIASVQNKSCYVIHYSNLIQCLANGLILTKIHRILEFEQSKWLKPFVDKNNYLLNNATNDADKKFHKSMTMAVLAKTLENVEKRTDLKFITHWESISFKRGAQYFINMPNYHSCSIFNENLVTMQFEKLRVLYDKPIYLAFCILDLSKLLMYNFHYQFMKQKYNNNLQLLYTCADSFIYEIHTDDFYLDIKSHLEFFDTADYPACNRFQMPLVNNKLTGKFKDLFDGKLLLEFVGTKSISFSYVVEDEKPFKQENNLNVSNFRTYLESVSSLLHHTNTVRYNVYTQLINKLALYCTDDKRFVIPNSEKTLPWGHSKIKEYCL